VPQPVGPGDVATTHAPPVQEKTVSQATSGSVPYSQSNGTSHALPTVGAAAGHVVSADDEDWLVTLVMVVDERVLGTELVSMRPLVEEVVEDMAVALGAVVAVEVSPVVEAEEVVDEATIPSQPPGPVAGPEA
jgi:hypothetical protein